MSLATRSRRAPFRRQHRQKLLRTPQPILVDSSFSTWPGIDASDEVTGTITWQTGDLIIVTGVTDEPNASHTLNTPTATGLTFTLVDSDTTNDGCAVWVWQATAGSNGSSAVTSQHTSGTTSAAGIYAYVWRNGVLGNTAKQVQVDTDVLSLVRAGDHSAVVFISGDWASIGGFSGTPQHTAANATPSPTPGGVKDFYTDATNDNTGSDLVAGHWYDQGLAGTTSYGLTVTATGTRKRTSIAVEIKYGTSTNATATPAVLTGTGSFPSPTIVITSKAAPANVAGTGTQFTPGATLTSAAGTSVLTGSGSLAAPNTVTAVTVSPTTKVGTATFPPLVTAIGLWPTTVHASGRYILDQHGDPWMMHGDTAWSLWQNLSLTDAKTYLDDRASRGVNLVIAQMDHFFETTPPQNVNGDAPFTGTAFQSSLNEPYWAHVDEIVDYAATKGITVLFFPTYLGFGGTDEGWNDEMTAASNAQVQAFGAALGARYKSRRNIIWCMGGDRTPDATLLDRLDHVMTGIRTDAGDTHLATAHGNHPNDAAATWNGYSWLDLNSVYARTSDTPNELATATTAYARATTRPVFFIEGRYENFAGSSTQLIREEQWRTFLAGGLGGHIVGNEDIWSFGFNTGFGTDYDWAAHLDDRSIDDSQLIWNLIDGHIGTAWKDLVPDTGDTFVTAGESTGTTQGAAAFSTTVGLAYKATTGSITVDLSVLTGANGFVQCRWYDVSTGGMSGLGNFATTGPQTFVHPGTNGAGDNDWLLVVTPAGEIFLDVDYIHGVGSFPAPTVVTGQTVAPSNVAGTGSGFTPGGTTTSAAGGGVVSGSGAGQAPNTVTAVTTTPAVLGTSGAGQAPNPKTAVTTPATTLTGTGSQFTPTGTTTSAAGAGTASGSATLGGSPVTAVTHTPSNVAGVGSQFAPTETVTSKASPSVIGGTGSLFFGGLSIAFHADFVAGVGSFPAPDVATSDTNTASPAVLVGVGTQPAPTFTVTSVAPATVLTGTGSQPTPGGSTTAIVPPGTVVGGAVFTTPSGSTTATVFSGLVTGVGSQPLPGTLVTVGPAPSTLTGVGSQPSPSPSTAVQATPPVVAGSGAAVTPILLLATTATPPVIPGIAVFPVPDIFIAADLVVLPDVLIGVGTQPTPVILARSSRAYVWDPGSNQWRSCPVKRWDGVAWVADLRPKAYDPVTAQWFPLNQV